MKRHVLNQKPYWHSLLDNYLSLIKRKCGKKMNILSNIFNYAC